MLQCGFVRSNFSLAIAVTLLFRQRNTNAGRRRRRPWGARGSVPSLPSSASRHLSAVICRPPSALERVKGIEPSSSAWKAVALPLSYTRALLTGGFGGGGWIRTNVG